MYIHASGETPGRLGTVVQQDVEGAVGQILDKAPRKIFDLSVRGLAEVRSVKWSSGAVWATRLGSRMLRKYGNN